MSLLVSGDLPAADLIATIKKKGGDLLVHLSVFDLYQGKGLPDGKKSIGISVTYGSSSKTLTDEEVSQVHTDILSTLTSRFGAELRS